MIKKQPGKKTNAEQKRKKIPKANPSKLRTHTAKEKPQNFNRQGRETHMHSGSTPTNARHCWDSLQPPSVESELQPSVSICRAGRALICSKAPEKHLGTTGIRYYCSYGMSYQQLISQAVCPQTK